MLRMHSHHHYPWPCFPLAPSQAALSLRSAVRAAAPSSPHAASSLWTSALTHVADDRALDKLVEALVATSECPIEGGEGSVLGRLWASTCGLAGVKASIERAAEIIRTCIRS